MAMHYDRCCKETSVPFGKKQQQACGDGLNRNSMASEYYSETLCERSIWIVCVCGITTLDGSASAS
eukprot:122176-Chlamydomonas_euryale.AAC.1